MAVTRAPSSRSAAWPWRDGRPPHLPLPDPVPPAFLLPGDPARVDRAAQVLDGFRIIGQIREFRMGVGTFAGVPVGVCSTGIGGASTEIVMVELAALGVRVAIRTGGMGALAPDLALGDFLVVTDCVPSSAVAAIYRDGAAPAAADPGVVAALEQARIALGLPGRIGRVATADGYYRAQGRPIRPGGAGDMAVLDRLQALGADGVEMEAEIVLAAGAACGLRTGAVLAVHAHRAIDGWLEEYEATQTALLRLGAEAAVAALGPVSSPAQRSEQG